jgi:hypothetical protein
MTNTGSIIFSAPEVQAILRGDKTQVRFPVKKLPHCPAHGIDPCFSNGHLQCKGCGHFEVKPKHTAGDILYVREAWKEDVRTGHDGYCYKADGPLETYPNNLIRWSPSVNMPRAAARIFLRVTDVRAERLQDITEKDARAEGIKSYFLHKEHGGEWHESSSAPFVGVNDTHCTRKKAFAELWDSLNVKCGHGWDTNPWVWAYTFERTEAPK